MESGVLYMNNKKGLFISKNIYILLFCFLIFSCASNTIFVQPHISSISVTKIIGDDAGVYISPLDSLRSYTKKSFFGGNIIIPLGASLRICAQEAFAPYFKRVFFIGSKDYRSAQYIIEVSIVSYEVTGGLDTHLNIKCSITSSEKIIFSGYFAGNGSGSAGFGSLGPGGILARDEIRKSTEEAFIDAFRKAQIKLNETLSK
jgi:hypothetical protein